MTAHDETRLPVWAQTELRQLRERVATLTPLVNGGPDDGAVTVTDLGEVTRKFPGEWTTVRFDLSPDGLRHDRWIEARFARHEERTAVELRCDGTGRELLTASTSSNLLIATSSILGAFGRATFDHVHGGQS